MPETSMKTSEKPKPTTSCIVVPGLMSATTPSMNVFLAISATSHMKQRGSMS